jgi:hypothetical protein
VYRALCPGADQLTQKLSIFRAGVCTAITALFLMGSAVAELPPVSSKGARVSDFHLSGVELRLSKFGGKKAFRMVMPETAWQDAAKEKPTDRNYMAWLPVDFKDGTIEADMASVLAPNAPEFARGFIGLAFRIDDNGRFESIYLRPANSTADDQVRRNHSVQYVAYPDYRFDRMRSEFPEKYETSADIGLNRWMHMKIEVRGQQARLYLDRNPRPVLVVQDMKLGSDQRGGVGIWLESGTIAYFRNLKITPDKSATRR